MKTIICNFPVVAIIVYSLSLAGMSPAVAQNKTPSPATKFSSDTVLSKAKITYKVIDAANNTFGYDIYVDGHLLIHQNTIPGVPGNKGFTTAKQAERIAKLVIKKINAGQLPPTVTREELKKLKVVQ
jgi:hypothetical protein